MELWRLRACRNGQQVENGRGHRPNQYLITRPRIGDLHNSSPFSTFSFSTPFVSFPRFPPASLFSGGHSRYFRLSAFSAKHSTHFPPSSSYLSCRRRRRPRKKDPRDATHPFSVLSFSLSLSHFSHRVTFSPLSSPELSPAYAAPFSHARLQCLADCGYCTRVRIRATDRSSEDEIRCNPCDKSHV